MTYPFYFYKRVTKRGNNFAIGSDGIGEALQRSASSMYAAGNTMEQTIGLVTAANEVVQDPSRIGNGFKTISMRIRGKYCAHYKVICRPLAHYKLVA